MQHNIIIGILLSIHMKNPVDSLAILENAANSYESMYNESFLPRDDSFIRESLLPDKRESLSMIQCGEKQLLNRIKIICGRFSQLPKVKTLYNQAISKGR